MLRLFFIVMCIITCFVCAMHVFEVRASSHPLTIKTKRDGQGYVMEIVFLVINGDMCSLNMSVNNYKL